MTAVIRYRIDPSKRMHRRFYRFDVHLDLFGQWCLMREWGRIGSAGQTRSLPSLRRAGRKLRSISSAAQRSGGATH